MKVLIAIDEDERFAKAITEHVTSQGWPKKTEFRILHVIDWPPEHEIHGSPVMEEYLERRYQAGKQLSEKIAQAISESCTEATVGQEILDGRVAERILNVAHGWGADRIILGSHGRTGFGLFVMGSVSNAVVTNASCTVTVVRPPAQH